MEGKGKDRKFDYITHGLDVNFGSDRWTNNSPSTTDISVAAWMEAAWKTIVENNNPLEFIEATSIHSAAAVDKDHKWVLTGAEVYASDPDQDENPMKIVRH